MKLCHTLVCFFVLCEYTRLNASFFSLFFSLQFTFQQGETVSYQWTLHSVYQSDFKASTWFLWLNMVISIRHESLYVAILIMFQEIHVFFFFFLMFYYFLNTRIFAAQVLICNMMHCRFSCILTVTEGQVLLQRCVLVSQQRKLHIYCTFMQKSGM